MFPLTVSVKVMLAVVNVFPLLRTVALNCANVPAVTTDPANPSTSKLSIRLRSALSFMAEARHQEVWVTTTYCSAIQVTLIAACRPWYVLSRSGTFRPSTK